MNKFMKPAIILAAVLTAAVSAPSFAGDRHGDGLVSARVVVGDYRGYSHDRYDDRYRHVEHRGHRHHDRHHHYDRHHERYEHGHARHRDDHHRYDDHGRHQDVRYHR